MTYLSLNQLKQYQEKGYLAPINVLSESEALAARQEIEFIENEMPNEINNSGRYNVHLISPKLEDQKRASAEYLKIRKIIKNKTKQFDNHFNFQSPIESVITSAYGKRRFINNNERSPHMALDLRGAVGREIFAPKTGKVVLAENHFYGGNKIILDHGGGLFTAYSHMSEILVKLEDVVEAGTVIGLVGMTGRVTGPHLHWEVFLNENRINPELLISLEYAQD